MLRWEDVVTKILRVLFIPFWLVWQVLRLFWRLVVDVAKNVYGRVVVIFGGLVLAGLTAYFLHVFH